jgi:hypothetical protein
MEQIMQYKDEISYNLICDTLEKEGWIKEIIFINEKAKYVASLISAKPGETTLVADIKCPKDQKILIRGTKNGDIKNFKDAYSIKLTLMDSLKNEISQFTKIRITKERTIEGISQIRCFYADISKHDNDHLYRPKQNILLQGEEHLFIYVIGENIGLKLPDVAIDSNHISFNIKTDIFTLPK